MPNDNLHKISQYTKNYGITFDTKKQLDDLLKTAVELNASDIFFVSGLPVRMLRYHEVYNLTHRVLSNTDVDHLMTTMYSEISKSELDRMNPINTAYRIHLNKQDTIRFRVNMTACEQGYSLSLRTIANTIPTLDQLGIAKEILAGFAISYGLKIVVGATGHGKSTTLASIIQDKLNNPQNHQHIISVEEPIEYLFHNRIECPSFIEQMQVGKHILTFAQGLREAVRKKPTSLFVGECRDYDTITLAIDAAKTGHGVLTTLHSTDVKQTILRASDLFPIEVRKQKIGEFIENITIICAQRLVKTIDGKLTAIREYLRFDQSIRDALRQTNNLVSCTEKLINQHGRTFEQDLNYLYQQGIISEITYQDEMNNL